MRIVSFLYAGQSLEHTLADAAEVVIGRAEEGAPPLALQSEGTRKPARSRVAVAQRALSQQHAKLTAMADGSLQIEDLGSRNGTYLRLPVGQPVDVPSPGEVLLGREVVIQVGAVAWSLPDGEAVETSAEAFVQMVARRLQREAADVRLHRGDEVLPASQQDVRLPLAQAGQLVVRWNSSTLHVEADAWLRAVVSLYNSEQLKSTKHKVPWEFTGATPSRLQVLKLAARIADSNCSVLIRGTTGSGKEVLAKDLHNHSRRAQRPFKAVNCSAIPEALFESELFGHARGAFTGASEAHIGLFEQADGGTLFLDELAELPLPMQAKLLRVLEDRKVQPVGSRTTKTVDVRVLAATNGNLEKQVAEGTFRADLLYRLNTVQLSIPPLLPDDWRLLTLRLLEKRGKEPGGETSAAEREELAACVAIQAWPGGVRQLRNTLERYLMLRERTMAVAANWQTALTLGAARPDETLPIPATVLRSSLPAAPLVASKLLDNLLFLATAKATLESNRRAGVSEIAAQVGLTYQGVVNRLRNLDIKLDGTADLQKLTTRLQEEQSALSPYLPWVKGVLGE